jgi:hypothetical protein
VPLVKSKIFNRKILIPPKHPQNAWEGKLYKKIGNSMSDTMKLLLKNVRIPGDYSINEKGVFVKDDDNPIQLTKTPIVIYAELRDNQQNNWQAILKWIDLDGNLREEAFDKSRLQDSTLAKDLMNKGFKLAFGKNEAFRKYLDEFEPSVRLRKAHSLGWFKLKPSGQNVFILPDQVLADPPPAEELFFRPEDDPTIIDSMTTSGSFEEWQSSVASLAKGKACLIFINNRER